MHVSIDGNTCHSALKNIGFVTHLEPFHIRQPFERRLHVGLGILGQGARCRHRGSPKTPPRDAPTHAAWHRHRGALA
ncbi:hypothetical protein N9L68_03105 [bacterium]|nr:hypothetical protein [bacterium]